jgi:DNA-binding transcriptional MerR regulator
MSAMQLAPLSLALREKSPEAFRTISEVAGELDVPQHVLRFWESRFAQIKPIKRAGGRRYYRPEDVDLLRGIRALLYTDGFTIKGVQKVLRERGLRHVAELGRTVSGVPLAVIAEDIDEPRHARAAIAKLTLAHAAPDLGAALVDEERESLELLLAELLQFKARLRAARANRTF